MRIMETAANAVLQQSRRLEASATRTATAGRPPAAGEKEVDIAAEAVERIDASALTSANLSVIKSEDERLGQLLDILA